MSVFCTAVVFLLAAVPAVAQSQTFEAISIRPARSGDPRDTRMRVQANGGLQASAVPVLLLLSYAYDVPVNPSPRLSGLPGWRDTYDIEARHPPPQFPPVFQKTKSAAECREWFAGCSPTVFKLVMRVEQKTRLSTLSPSHAEVRISRSRRSRRRTASSIRALRRVAITSSSAGATPSTHGPSTWTTLPCTSRTGRTCRW